MSLLIWVETTIVRLSESNHMPEADLRVWWTTDVSLMYLSKEKRTKQQIPKNQKKKKTQPKEKKPHQNQKQTKSKHR